MIDQNKQFIYLHAPLTNRANQCHDTIKTVFRNTFTSSKVLLVYDPHCTVVVKCPFPKALPPYTILGLCHTTCFFGLCNVMGQWSMVSPNLDMEGDTTQSATNPPRCQCKFKTNYVML